MEPRVHLEELDRAWNAVMSRRLGRAGTVEAEPEGLKCPARSPGQGMRCEPHLMLVPLSLAPCSVFRCL